MKYNKFSEKSLIKKGNELVTIDEELSKSEINISNIS